ncbi:MAG: aminotransferase class V-fold PLP-dependent enzyme [candidate division KSB1 bacterium]|nr:aminotransferase class V-fold PLP-dependent enzyme [candidate division KSB1 bacterium]MDZ7275891.1 aminotransferase class V-fold PLP-dependent enzyme [candidate division KSB1 bacterium]MDZ7287641.1 aminotransferase class V-fold PLP-dependent enzyme [candidate division KSB1 bacterium]MDZ7306803.1 aminotransferase class V-fold PLP-dependent enzyme [candidate division KSB1 bacterium]MDZ7350619.1 aminotransferase class V-fold PLP-dependent enzyme [candidate division KSB1 bacterium]
MYNRRSFLGTLGGAAAALLALPALRPARWQAVYDAFAGETRPPAEVASDEALWFEVQQAFTVDRSLINLNNGGVSPSPAIVQAAVKRHLDFSNQAPVYTMWQILEPEREGVRQRLARTFGCDAEEIAVTRNASEGLQICQFGFDLAPGDEVLTTNQDYPRMITSWQQRERRDRIKLRQFSLPVPCEDPALIVSLFEKNITPRTRLILMCHMINLTGQILPVKEVVQMARRRGIPVIVDGAHAFAHFAFTQADLDCDYYATSLHKWLCAPHGTGMLYVRRDRIKSLWPMMAAPALLDDNIRKFEEIGTHPAANFLAIAEALTFHQGIGAQRKEARLIYLRDRWAKRLLQHERVRLHTSLKPGFAGGLATVQIQGVDSVALTRHLWEQHRIIVVPIKHAEFEGIRVTPNVYTTLEEIDRFADAMEQVIKHGLPKT